MLFFLFNILFVNPFLEWAVHKGLHDYNIKYHKDHHIQEHHNRTEKEYYFLFIMPALYYSNLTTLSIGAANYALTHSAIHFYPQWVDKELLQHHQIHHMLPKYNFAVTSIIPDLFMQTRYSKIK